jgi:cytochrome c biogenesis protein CcmG/thiol:disulfide interchange protein DsbE
MPIRFVLPLAVFTLIVGVFAYLLVTEHDASKIPSVLIDKPAPTFELGTIDDSRPGLATADLAGQVSVVNFFASWCLPCRAEHPLLIRLAEEGFAVYGINYKNERADAIKWLAELGNPYRRIGADDDGRAGIEWGVYGLPETFVLDKGGRIRFKHVGPITPQDLDEVILPILRKLDS